MGCFAFGSGFSLGSGIQIRIQEVQKDLKRQKKIYVALRMISLEASAGETILIKKNNFQRKSFFFFKAVAPVDSATLPDPVFWIRIQHFRLNTDTLQFIHSGWIIFLFA
jgi:hypothetical protein